VLTSERWTPLAFASAQHTIMVEVKKTSQDGQDKKDKQDRTIR
jgi:hypothetical protein